MMAPKHQILRSSIVVGFFSLLGGLTGILVETSIAANLGLSRSSDTFYAAFTIPYIVTNLLAATGQFSLVPFFASLEARHSEQDLWRGFSYVVNVIILGLGVIAALGAAASPWVILGIAPGFTRPQTQLAIQLSQWLFLIIIPAGVAEVFRSFLLSHHRFALPTATGLLRNVSVIVVILAEFHRYGPYSIVLGYFAGYLLQVLALGAHLVFSFRVRYSLTLSASGEAFRNLRGSGTAQLAAAAGWQGVVIVERIIASFLTPGSLTALNYGFKILSTLAELLGGSVGTAALPSLSRAVAREEKGAERKTFQTMLEFSMVLVAPVTVFCLLLSRPIMQLVFQRGNFTAQATDLMAAIFFYYSLSLLPYSFIRMLTFCFFARHESVVFLRLSLFQYGLGAGFDLLYVGVFRMGTKGLPLALLTSLLITSALAIRRNLAGLRSLFDRALGIFTLKTSVGAVLAGTSVWGLCSWVRVPQGAAGNFLYLCMLCGAGSFLFLVTLAACRAFALSELAALWKRAEDA